MSENPAPLCLTLKLKCPPANDCKKDETNTFPLPEDCHSRRYLQELNGLFYFVSSPPPSPIRKRTWHPDPDKMVILRFSLLSSQSAGFLNKVIFLTSTSRLLDSLASHAPSRASLDSVIRPAGPPDTTRIRRITQLTILTELWEIMLIVA